MVMPALLQHRMSYKIDILSLFAAAETVSYGFHSLTFYSFEFRRVRKPAGLLSYGVVKDMGEDSQIGIKAKLHIDHVISKILEGG